VTLLFEGTAFEWRGPAPFLFVRLPDDVSQIIKDHSKALTYGWGCIPVDVLIGATAYSTSLFPKDGGYLLPLKVLVQKAEEIEIGSEIRGEVALRLKNLSDR
jgi:hypothetical protein